MAGYDRAELLAVSLSDRIDHFEVLGDGDLTQFVAGESAGSNGVGGEGVVQDRARLLLVTGRPV